MDEEELLAEHIVSTAEEDRTLELITAFIQNRSPEILTECDAKLVELAVEKISVGLKEAKKRMLTEEDILGVANLQVKSSPSSVISSQSTSTGESRISEVNMDYDLDLDYEEEFLPEETHLTKRSITPITLSSDTEPGECEKSSSEDEEDDEEEERNKSESDFSCELNRDKPYLKMKKFKSKVDINNLNLVYPLGVTFDCQSSTWFITDKIKQTVVKINDGSNRRKRGCSVIKNRLLTTPTAITVLKEGSQVAVLCTDTNYKPAIRVIDIRTEIVTDYCSWRDVDLDFNYPTRGLARSLNGNLLTTDRPPGHNPRLRIITKRHRQKSFELKGAEVPSFIASSGSTVVITDLGKEQVVLHIKLDDTDLKNTTFEILRTISTCGVNLKASEMLNKQYFMYVAGAQIDRNGNILIADAKNHHFKLFKPTMGFIHRVSTDFPVPYVSSFHVNEYGEILILGTRNDKVTFAKLSSTDRLEPHIAAAYAPRPAVKSYFSSKKSYRYDDDDD